MTPPSRRARFAVELRSDHVRRLVADAKRRVADPPARPRVVARPEREG